MRESSEPGLCGLIARSIRCISAITASAAALASDRPSHQSSTRIAVPMMASSRVNQPGTSAGRAAGRAELAACKGSGPAPKPSAVRLPCGCIPKNMAPPKHQGRARRRCCDWPTRVIDARQSGLQPATPSVRLRRQPIATGAGRRTTETPLASGARSLKGFLQADADLTGRMRPRPRRAQRGMALPPLRRRAGVIRRAAARRGAA